MRRQKEGELDKGSGGEGRGGERKEERGELEVLTRRWTGCRMGS